MTRDSQCGKFCLPTCRFNNCVRRGRCLTDVGGAIRDEPAADTRKSILNPSDTSPFFFTFLKIKVKTRWKFMRTM